MWKIHSGYFIETHTLIQRATERLSRDNRILSIVGAYEVTNDLIAKKMGAQ